MPTLHGRFDLFAPPSAEPCRLCGDPGASARYRPVELGVDVPGEPILLHALCAAIVIDLYRTGQAPTLRPSTATLNALPPERAGDRD